MSEQEIRKELGRVICRLREDARECAWCASHEGCPDSWLDVAGQVDQIIKLLPSLGYRLIEITRVSITNEK